MFAQGIGPVLGKDIDPFDSGVIEVTEDEIDNFILAAKGNTRFGAAHGQRTEPLTLSPGKDHCNRTATYAVGTIIHTLLLSACPLYESFSYY